MSACLILGPRPGKKSKDQIRAQGVTDIVTLLSPREQPESIKKIAANIGADWHHSPIDGGHLETLASVDLAAIFLMHDEIARAGEDRIIYVHCSAGIHRTGFVTYALLRYRGFSVEAAMAELKALREVTFEQVGEARIALAEDKFKIWQAA
jgi:protein-tyrosine phosphatase